MIVIPAFNEEKTVGKVVKKALKHDKVIVVDDGSTDKTCDVAYKAGARTFIHLVNRGKGEALATAFKFVEDEKLFVIDADGQYDADDIPILSKMLDCCDYVLGQRDWSQVPFKHRLANWVWVRTFNLLYGTDYEDVTCGIIGMKKNVYTSVNPIHGYVVDVHMLIEALKMGAVVKHVRYVDVQYTETSGVADGLRMFMGIWIYMIARRFSW